MDSIKEEGIYLRKNTPEIIEKLKLRGITVCICVDFNNAIWLTGHYISELERTNGISSVHGLGYSIHDENESPEYVISEFLKTTKKYDCGENEDLFIDLISYSESTDLGQLFILEGTDRIEISTEEEFYGKKLPTSSWRKLNIEEIIKLHTNE